MKLGQPRKTNTIKEEIDAFNERLRQRLEGELRAAFDEHMPDAEGVEFEYCPGAGAGASYVVDHLSVHLRYELKEEQATASFRLMGGKDYITSTGEEQLYRVVFADTPDEALCALKHKMMSFMKILSTPLDQGDIVDQML